MLSLENLKEFTNKGQTRLENIIREYIQHLFLSSLYKIKGSEKLLLRAVQPLKLFMAARVFPKI